MSQMPSVLKIAVFSFGVVLVTAGLTLRHAWTYAFTTPRAKKTYRTARLRWLKRIGRYTPPMFGHLLQRNGLPTEPAAYTYPALNAPRDIRILHVTCVSGGPPKRFTCNLEVVSLDSPARYLAVSYAWGCPDIVATIPSVEGQLGLTQSNVTILDTILEPGMTLPLWIDALCINQHDPDEKAAQVLLMKDVYDNAHQVIVCLGEPTDETDNVLDLMEPLANTLHTLEAEGTLQISQMPNFAKPTLDRFRQVLRKECYESSELDMSALATLHEIYCRPFFQRIWVVQEVSLAKSDPILVCGDRAVYWSPFQYAINAIIAYGIDASAIVNSEHPEAAFAAHALTLHPMASSRSRLANIIKMAQARDDEQAANPKTLQQLLMDLIGFEASDDRDRIYGLLGLASNANEASLHPDYRAPTEDVFIRTAGYLLTTDPALVLLHRAGVGVSRNIATLPSWVPDWTSIDVQHACFGSRKIRHILESGAGGPEPAQATLGEDGRRLTVKGWIVDRIREVGPVQSDIRTQIASEGAFPIESWFVELDHLVDRLRSRDIYVDNDETLDQALARTLVANEQPLPVDSSNTTEYFHCYGAMREMLAEGTSFSELSMLMRYFTTMCWATNGRRFCVTDNGYMGLGNEGTRCGDLLCILQGSRTPFIARKEKTGMGDTQTWVLVGEVYFHGLMNAEGVAIGMEEEFVFV